MEERKEKLIPWHSQSVKDVLATLKSSRKGLLTSEASERLKESGGNALPESKQRSAFSIFVVQFANPFMVILIFAGGVSLFLGEILDMGVIAAAVLINVILGFVEEYKADRSLEALKKYLPEVVSVRRGGVIVVIPSEEVVEGDVMLILTGNKITADGRIITSSAFETNEAALTGESSTVKKSNIAVGVGMTIGDRSSMVFAGTVAVSGKAEVIVTGTGTHTEIGQISELVAGIKEEKTPLQKQLDSFAKILGITVLVLALIIFVIGVLRGFSAGEMFYISVALSVAAVPEGLIVAVTVVLAIGMQRILKKKALVRRLVAAETLGSVSVICADKTGTLTTGVMSVDEIRINGNAVDIDSDDEKLQKIRQALARVNATLVEIDHKTKQEVLQGSPTDLALYRYVRDFVDISKGVSIGEIPFNSQRKFLAGSFRIGARYHIFAAGAPEVLLDRSDLTDVERKLAQDTLKSMTKKGLRVLLVGESKDIPHHKELTEEMVIDLDILGFVGLRDPLRAEARESLEESKRAGLRPVMITGDHPETARQIALDAGFNIGEHGLMIGEELDRLSDDQLIDKIESVQVFARVVPKHKLRIVRAWQKLDQSVAMTGDGVNDAPAIKAADIGIALGSGTSVAKQTADMVLLDNNFKTIVAAIREGRIIFDNLRKMIVYLLADSFSEILLVFGALAMGMPLPILPAQILWINLVADGLPAIALTFEPGEKEIMNEPPRKKNASILNKEMLVLIFLIGIITDVMLFIVFWYLNGRGMDIVEIRTFIYVALGFDSLFYVFAVRKFRRSIFISNPLENKWLVASVVIGFVLLLIPIWVAPLREVFQFTYLTSVEWLALIALAVIDLILIEAVKEIYNRKRLKKIKVI